MEVCFPTSANNKHVFDVCCFSKHAHRLLSCSYVTRKQVWARKCTLYRPSSGSLYFSLHHLHCIPTDSHSPLFYCIWGKHGPASTLIYHYMTCMHLWWPSSFQINLPSLCSPAGPPSCIWSFVICMSDSTGIGRGIDGRGERRWAGRMRKNEERAGPVQWGYGARLQWATGLGQYSGAQGQPLPCWPVLGRYGTVGEKMPPP
jgi:hypothetical protein